MLATASEERVMTYSSTKPESAGRLRPTATVRTRKGYVVRVRPVEPDDRELMVEGFDRLSDRSRYLRFMAPTDHLSDTQLDYLSHIDYLNHFAWGVLDPDGTPVAIGRFVRFRDEPDAADVALTVIDDHQGRGIGTLLIQSLALVARRRGIVSFHFDVLPSNEAMLAVLESMQATSKLADGIVHLVIPVAEIEPPQVLDGDLGRLADRMPARPA
jgi:RimJ/RimL family protein N-acetyltransferase